MKKLGAGLAVRKLHIIIICLALLLVLLMTPYILRIVRSAARSKHLTGRLSDMKTLARCYSEQIYYSEQHLDTDSWATVIKSSSPECSAILENKSLRYSFNPELSGVMLSDVGGKEVLFVQTDVGNEGDLKLYLLSDISTVRFSKPDEAR